MDQSLTTVVTIRPLPNDPRDFEQIRRMQLTGSTAYRPYGSTAGIQLPAEACGILKCGFCGTAIAVTIRGAQPQVTADCPGCGAPIRE